MPRRILLSALCSLALLAAAPSAQAVTTYRGQWQCSDRGTVLPFAGAQVELWSRGATWLPPALVGRRVDQGHTGEDGRYSLQAPSDRDGYYARVVYTDARGLHVRNLIALGDYFENSAVLPNDAAVEELGGSMSSSGSTSSPPCAIYDAFHDTWSDYLTAVGSAPPFPALSINTYVPFIGVPFTAPGSIQWPWTFNVGATPGVPTVPAHEFAHAFRFDFDGDYAHFLLDVVGYAYPQNHNICDLKNEGFAFNEGWAEYWSRQVTGQPDCPGAATDDYRVEGRVAAALAELESRCAGGNRATMVDVLRANRGTIHSFAAFRDHLPCPAPASVAVPPQSVGVFTPSASNAAALLKAQVATLGKDISAIKRTLPAADRAADHVPSCVHKPCLRALKAETRAPGLRGEIALLRARRAALRGLLLAATRRKLASRNADVISRELRARSRRLARATARAGRKALRAILRHARPVLRKDHSRRTRLFAKQMRKLLAQLGKAVRGGPLPAGFAAFPDGIKPPRHVPVRSFPPRSPGAPALPSPPAPAPTPAPDTRADTTLTLNCPSASVVAPQPVEISGNLAPAVAGATVHVSYTAKAQTNHDATTDVNGDYKDASGPTTPGTYTVRASWDGDGGHKPASAPACTANVG
jgi:hypothetical protein